MKTWTRVHTFVAGMALISATNAVALFGVVYNRGATESTLKLTERELHLPYDWGFENENSGIALALQWRLLPEQSAGRHGVGASYAGFGMGPGWLDKAKLTSLGFDVSKPENTPQGRLYYEKLLPREVLLVLELDGQAYRTALARAREHSQEEASLFKANAGTKEFENRAKDAKQALYQEERINSRLFVVDAGLEATGLRAKYPDPSRYAVVRGQIQPQLVEINSKPVLTAYISGFSIDQINVPARYRRMFEPLRKNAQGNEYGVAAPPFEVTVAFGRRLEPWITEARAPK